MGNILYNYNDNDFLTAHCRESFNLLIFKVLFCIPLLSQIYRKNVLKGLSDPTLTKPNGCFSEPLRTCRSCWTCWSSFSPWAGDFPCLLRALLSCSCLLNVQIPWKGGPLYRISWGTHQPIPAPATSTWREFPEPHPKFVLFLSLNSASEMASWRRWGLNCIWRLVGFKVELGKEHYVGRWPSTEGRDAEQGMFGWQGRSLRYSYSFRKRLSGRGLFHLLGPSVFLNVWKCLLSKV